MRRLPFLAGSLLAAIAVSACNSTQDVLEPSAIAASPPAPGTLQAETRRHAGAERLNQHHCRAQSRHRSAHEAALRSDRRRNGRCRDALDRTARPARQGARYHARRQRRSFDHPYTEGLFLDLDGGWPDHRHLRLGRLRLLGQPASPHQTASRKPPARRGWAAVPPATMQAIADSTVDQLTSWLGEQHRMTPGKHRFVWNNSGCRLQWRRLPLKARPYPGNARRDAA